MAIFMCMLVMAMIPAAAGISDKQTPQSNDMGRTWIWGIIAFYKGMNIGFSFRCVMVRFTTVGILEHYSGGLHGLEKIELRHGLLTGYVSSHIILGNFAGELVVH